MSSQPRKDFLIPFLTVLGDVLAIETAFQFSYWLRFFSPFTDVVPVTLGVPTLGAYVVGSMIVIPVWLYLFHSRHMYAARRNVYFSDEFFAIVRIVFFGMLVVMSAAFFYRAFSYSRAVFALLGFFSVVFISLERYFMLRFEQFWYARGKDLKEVVLVGTNATARRVYDNIALNPALGYHVVGFFSTNGLNEMETSGVDFLGHISHVPQYIRDHKIDIVLVSLTYRDHPQLFELVRDSEGLNTEIMMVPDLLDLMTSRVRIKELHGIPFIKVKAVPLTTWNLIVKRSFDLMTSAFFLLLASPVFGVVSLLIKRDSKGPVFFSQERIGLDGKPFRLIKFRTMLVDAERETGPVWAQKNDPRTTPVGRFLRRFSIDELPQLINVFRGDMSIVGPRPERQHFVDRFKRDIPKYLDRHRVKTGMTGWAQVNGLRGNAPIEERTKYDMYYVENWSLVFDLKIILKTVHAVFFAKDAYEKQARMVAAFIFLLHIIAAGYAFTSRKKTGGMSEGLLAVAFIGIVFAVGWTIATMLTNLLFTPEFFIKWYYHQTNSMFLRILRKEISRDTISLLILTFGEIVFYYFFLKGDGEEQASERSGEKKEPGKSDGT